MGNEGSSNYEDEFDKMYPNNENWTADQYRRNYNEFLKEKEGKKKKNVKEKKEKDEKKNMKEKDNNKLKNIRNKKELMMDIKNILPD